MTDGLAVLEQRAQRLATPASALRPDTLVHDVLCFRLGVEQHAIETCFVWRALREVPVTPLPVADPCVLGLFNLQGELLPVFELAHLLGVQLPAAGGPRNLLVLGREQPELAVAVDGFEETERLDVASWLEPGPGPARASPFVRGVTPGARVVLDGAALLSDARLYIDESSAVVTARTREDR
jgi:chemotaxis signal transduction protein